MPRYNLAYCPSDPDFSDHCVQYANNLFAAVATSNLLNGHSALAHVTLCQFNTAHKSLHAIWQLACGICRMQCDLEFDDLYFIERDDYISAGINIVRTPELSAEQSKLVAALEARGITTRTRIGENYSPHLTLAHIVERLNPKPRPALKGARQSFHLTLGVSDDNGVYQKKLFSTLDPA